MSNDAHIKMGFPDGMSVRGGGNDQQHASRNENRTNTQKEEIIIRIPGAKLQAILPRLFHNKVILTFAGSCSDEQVKSWVLL